MNYFTQNVQLGDYEELTGHIWQHADVWGLDGALCTDIFHATHPLFVPIVAEAQRFHCASWETEERPVQAWGVRLRSGIRISPHAHPAQRYSVLYYLTEGASLYIEGEEIPIYPGLMVTFPGTSEHWTDYQIGRERYSVACAFG